MNVSIKYIGILIVGIAAGVAISNWLNNSPAKPDDLRSSAALPVENTESALEKPAVPETTENVEEAMPKAQAQQVQPEAPVASQENEEESSPGALSKSFRKMAAHVAKNMPKGQYETELAKLATALDLSPSQIDAIEQYYIEMEERQSELTQQIFEGKSLKDMQAEIAAQATSGQFPTLSKVLAEHLTPEQAEQYKAYKEREKTEKQEAQVLGELAKIQKSVTMSGEQKDAVYAILYDQNYKLKAEELEKLESKPGSMAYALELKIQEDQKLLESISTILTLDQLEVYERQQAKEQALLKMATGMMGDILE